MEHRKLDALMTPVERIARVAAAGVNLAKAPQTAPSGAISLDNADGTRTIIGEVVNGESNPSYTMATHVGDETPPGVPTGITATSKSGVVVVEWDGTLDGGIPDDFFCVRVYLDGTELGALTEAGSVASAKLDGGTTVLVTATSEDDCCLPDGTPDHNVSAASQAISVTVTSSAEEIVVDVEEEIEGVQQEITDFKEQVQGNYYNKTTIDQKTEAITNEVGAVYRDSMARNLSPFYSHDFTDVSTTDAEAYWHTLTTAKTEQLSDGWAHVTLDNSAGTSNLYAYATVRAAFLPIVAGTVMVEIRNVQVATEGRWGIGRTAQGLTFPQLDVTEAGIYYRPATVNNPDPANGVAISLRFYALAGVSVEFDARISYYQGEYTGAYKPYNADTANLTRDYATKTWTDQTAEDYSIAAAQKYTATLANANLGPWYAHDLADIKSSDKPGAWWGRRANLATQLSDGWARIVLDNSTGTGTLYSYVQPNAGVVPAVEGTLLLEVRNVVTDATGESSHRLWFNPQASAADAREVYGDAVRYFTEAGTFRIPISVTGSESPSYWCNMWFAISAGHQATFEARISFYANAQDGTETIPYDGPFKPFVTDQQALSKEYATQSQLTVGLNGILTTVSQTYETKDHAGVTYANKTTTEQTFSEIDTRVTQNATNIEGEILARETLIRQYANGVLVCKVGEAVGALVNASGSFDVVSVTWSGNNPTVTGTLSTFGEESQIGRSGEARLVLDYHSLEYADADGDVYFEVRDLRDRQGRYEYTTPIIYSLATAMRVDLPKPLISVERVTLNGEDTSNYSVDLAQGCIWVDPTVKGDAIQVTCITESETFKSMTFGSRAAGTEIGRVSAVIGIDCTASGLNSTAIGGLAKATGYRSVAVNQSTASGSGSFAEGDGIASGMFAHAEGSGSTASGAYSHAGGVQTIASKYAATAIGYRNYDDPDALLMVGNGQDLASRSNAFQVNKDGTVIADGNSVTPVELFSGSTAGTVTLSETAANFDRLVIYYAAGGSGSGSVELTDPDGKTFSMQGMYFASSANIVQQRFKVMSISGTSITRVSSGYVNTSTSGAVSVNTSENNIEVKRVIGYRTVS